jgi:hypothetical protein
MFNCSLLFYHSGSSLFVNLRNRGIKSRTISIKLNSKISIEDNDKSNMTVKGIVMRGNKTNAEVAFLEELL